MFRPKKSWFLFFLIFLVALLLRIYHLELLTTFGGDQGQDFLVVRDMVLFHKWTLLGIKTSAYAFFQGPLYLYMLLPFFAIFKLQPIAGSIAAVFYSSVTLILLFVTVKKYFSVKLALISSAFYAVSPGLVVYGNTPLYQHFLPIFIILSFYFLLIPKKNLLTGILLGLTLGLGIETHLLNVSLLVTAGVFLVLFDKCNWKALLGTIFGTIVGLAPTILFELRHNFLNTQFLLSYYANASRNLSLPDILTSWADGAGTFLGANSIFLGAVILIFVLTATFIKKNKNPAHKKLVILAFLLVTIIFILSLVFSAFAPFYILPFWLLLLILIPVLIEKVLPKKIGIFVFALLILANLVATLRQMNINHGYTMPPGWSLKKTQQATKIIKEDSKTHPNFNIASLLEGQTKAYTLRYSLLVEGASPEPMNNYASNNYLYLIAQSRSELGSTQAWEVISFVPYKIGETWNLDGGIYLFRLDRESWSKLLQTK